MLPAGGDALAQQLVGLVRQSPALMAALQAVRSMDLPSWAIGAGAVRNVVWDHLHGYKQAMAMNDVDVVYYDADHTSRETEMLVQHRLCQSMPHIQWDVTNQAAVHLWYAQVFGQIVTPLTSLHEGIATWPEYATCVGISLSADDQLQVIAPYGLDDLFAMRVSWNPARVSAVAYSERVRQKAFTERWPRVSVEFP